MHKAVMRRVNLHLLPMFFCVALLCNLDRWQWCTVTCCPLQPLTDASGCRANLAFAAPQLNADLHFTKPVYGFGSGVLPATCLALSSQQES